MNEVLLMNGKCNEDNKWSVIMDNYIEILDSLMKAKKEKKKKEPTIREKEAFRTAWLGLVVETGFVGRAEQFLYEGFAFCGAEPFYAYLVQTSDQNATLGTLFSGKCYGSDSNVSFRLVANLLALMLNDNAKGNVLAPVIKRFPSACVNKEKKRLGTAEKTLEKYFLAELRPVVELSPLAGIETKPVFIKDFIALVSSIMDGIEKTGSTKKEVANNIAKIRKWFSDYDCSTSVGDDIKPILKESTARIGDDIHDDSIAHLAELLDKASKVVKSVESESMQQRSKIAALTLTLEDEQNKLRKSNQRIENLQGNLVELRNKLVAAESEIIALRKDLEQKDMRIAEKDAEIADRVRMVDVISKDRNKQADEALQRLAAKIRIEYRDFIDALDVPMNSDLGENLKIQLQSVFEILEKGGMKIK